MSQPALHKIQVKEELKDELVTKKDLELAKLELKHQSDKLGQRMNLLIILVVILLTLMNPVMAEFVKSLLK